MAAGAAFTAAELRPAWVLGLAGGITARLHAVGAEQGGFGLHFALPDELRALNGPTLCRPCTVGFRYPELDLWWFLLPVLGWRVYRITGTTILKVDAYIGQRGEHGVCLSPAVVRKPLGNGAARADRGYMYG